MANSDKIDPETKALAMFGEFFQTWAFLEHEVIRCIEKALGLNELQRTAVFTHIMWRDRIDILRNLLSLTPMASAKRKEHDVRLVKISKLAVDRNLAAHNAFLHEDDGSLVFYQRKAKGKIELPQVKWTRKLVDQKINRLWSEIAYLKKLREDIQRLKSSSSLVNALAGPHNVFAFRSGLADQPVEFPPTDHEEEASPEANGETDPPEQQDQ
ncbi:MAG: hypothetical protein ABNH49_11365 [Hyphomonas sp.]|jgi:hypothetical protein